MTIDTLVAESSTVKVWTTEELKNSYKKKYYSQSFKGLDLRHADFRLATCSFCDFTDCDLRNANFEGANCFGSNFTDANMKRLNAKDCSLENTVMKPKDCFGMTLTLHCSTYANMEVNNTWLSCWLFIPSSWRLPPVKVDGVLDKDFWLKRIIHLLGENRYSKLKFVFDRRII